VGWYVIFKKGSETLTKTVDHKDEALLVARDLYRQGRRVLSVGPFGREVHSHRTINGAALQVLLRKLAKDKG
jgi:hypothetical protein